MTPSGIETATFGLVAQSLNQMYHRFMLRKELLITSNIIIVIKIKAVGAVSYDTVRGFLRDLSWRYSHYWKSETINEIRVCFFL